MTATQTHTDPYSDPSEQIQTGTKFYWSGILLEAVNTRWSSLAAQYLVEAKDADGMELTIGFDYGDTITLA